MLTFLPQLAGSQAALDAQREQSQEMREYYNRATDDPIVAIGSQELAYGFDAAHNADDSAAASAARIKDELKILVEAIARIGRERLRLCSPVIAKKPRAFHAHFEPRADRNCMVGWDGARAQRT